MKLVVLASLLLTTSMIGQVDPAPKNQPTVNLLTHKQPHHAASPGESVHPFVQRQDYSFSELKVDIARLQADETSIQKSLTVLKEDNDKLVAELERNNDKVAEGLKREIDDAKQLQYTVIGILVTLVGGAIFVILQLASLKASMRNRSVQDDSV